MELTQSLEDYLEAILILEQTKKVVRVRDIVKKLKVRAASVVGSLKTLEKSNFVVHERYGYVELTGEGRRIAENVYKRHKTLYKFFREILDVPPCIADNDACNIEHYISKKTFEELLTFLDFVNRCPEKEVKWLSAFRYFQKTKSFPEECIGGQMNLSEVKPGIKVKIKGIEASPKLKRKLLDMGIIPGDYISVIKVAPLGDPMEIRVKNYNLTLRKEEAKKINIEEEG